MAGMDALVENLESKAFSNIVNVNVTSTKCKSPQASPSAVNLESGCAASMWDALQETALSMSTASAPEVQPLVPSEGVAGSSTINATDSGMTCLNNLSSGVEACSVTGEMEACAKSCWLLGTGKGSCNTMINPQDLEKEKNLVEARSHKDVQVCAICHEKIKVQETAEIKGCEHSYCVTCILRWATYKAEPWCPQCRLPFSFLYVYRALDGSLSDYLFEESVCLLLRAFWFKPLIVQEPEEQDDYQDDYDAYEEPYYTSNVRLGNRRWGDSGYVRTGRREARPVSVRQVGESGSSSSRQAKDKEPAKEAVGRRARRAQKREELDKISGKK